MLVHDTYSLTKMPGHLIRVRLDSVRVHLLMCGEEERNPVRTWATCQACLTVRRILLTAHLRTFPHLDGNSSMINDNWLIVGNSLTNENRLLAGS